jgi:hypothetical protein
MKGIFCRFSEFKATYLSFLIPKAFGRASSKNFGKGRAEVDPELVERPLAFLYPEKLQKRAQTMAQSLTRGYARH